MMIADALNSRGYPVRTEMTATKQMLSLHICSIDESELKEFLVNETLSQSCSIDKEKSNGIIVNKTLLKNCSMDKDKSKRIIVKKGSTEDNESESRSIIVNECSMDVDTSECARKERGYV